MAPPNEPDGAVQGDIIAENKKNWFELSDGKLSVQGIPLLYEVPKNISFNAYSSICCLKGAPLSLLRQVHSKSHKGGFLGFTKGEPSDRLMNSMGKFDERKFLSVFRFKTWWTTMWVGRKGSDLQMESQWLLLDVPELRSYVLILPLIEGKFRSALHPGIDNHVMICAESGSTKEKASSFQAIAYVHMSDNPYELMKEAYSAVRVHLKTFKLLEEKSVPSLVDKFGWCTWDAFYLTVEPMGVWHGVNEFHEQGISLRFIIIDDGWQSISFDGEEPTENEENLVLGGSQMTARLYSVRENGKFRKYKARSMLGKMAPSFDPRKPKMLIEKAIEVENVEKAMDKAIQSGITDLSELESKVQRLKHELNEMFRNETDESSRVNDQEEEFSRNCSKPGAFGMKAFTMDLRKKFKRLDDVYVWHALCGAWGGVRPGTTHLDSKVIPCKLSPGLDGTMTDLAVVKIVEAGIGLIPPEQVLDFYDSLHSYLSDAGITGVKVDVIHALEYVSEEYGGRVELAKAYYEGLTKSLIKNFHGTGLISSMQQCNDFFFLATKQISMGRVGDDFWFQDPNGDPMGVYWLQGVHMIHCAYNSLWMGQMIQPDWDMFQSDHICAMFHAGSRAISGGPVYLSDSVGFHDFELIKRLVFPDGTIPKCQHFALPTRDCLFNNPLFDKKTILKIWNLNKFGGVIGAFNCQGAGWDPKEKKIRGYPQCYQQMMSSVRVDDIEWNQKLETTKMGDADEYALYLNQSKELHLVTPKSDPFPITIKPSSFEIFSFSPIRKLGLGVKFAPIGLTNMLNSGGTILEVDYDENYEARNSVNIKVKGAGEFLAYSSSSPKRCYLNGSEVDFEWLPQGKLTMNLQWMEDFKGISNVSFTYLA